LRLALDAGLRIYGNGRVLVARGRIIRLTEHGPAALRALLAGTPTPAQRRLGARLVAAGMAHPRPSPQQRPTTIVIPVRDRPEDLTRLLTALQGGQTPTTARRGVPRFVYQGGLTPLVVVDDGSRVPVVGAIRREVAGGPAAARNEGLRHVDTELVAFLDSDTVPPAGWIEQLAGHFEDPDVAAVAPRIRDRLLDMGPLESEVGPGRAVSYVPSAALLVRRCALPEGPFDPALRYGEDVDLIWRLLDAGWRVRYDPRVVVWHEERDTFRRRFMYGTSASQLAARHPDKLRHIVVRPWPAVTLGLLAARRPRLAALAYLAQTAVLARVLRSKGVPIRLAPVWTARALVPTAWQFAKLASPYGAGVLYGRISTKIGGLPTILGPSIHERTRRQSP
jgi:mycofactocin system glycosyltransferase